MPDSEKKQDFKAFRYLTNKSNVHWNCYFMAGNGGTTPVTPHWKQVVLC